MAAKWKAQQRKQRWEHSAVILPEFLIARVSSEVEVRSFAGALREWSTLGNTYDQVAGAKRLVGALEALEGVERAAFSVALGAYVEILFLEGSKPVHRTMLSALAQMSQFEELVVKEFYRCCCEYAVEKGGASPGEGDETKQDREGRRFALVSAGLSLANMPNPGILRSVINTCSSLIALAACRDVGDALARARGGENSTPALMEECQDAMSTVYYMLQSELPERKSEVYVEVVLISLDVLQTSLLSRDCVVAAGVCLCAAAQRNSSSLGDLALLLASSLFPQAPGSRLRTLEDQPGKEAEVESVVRCMRSSTLAGEAGKFTEFGTLCVLRGLLTAAPRELLNFCLLREASEKQEMEAWSLLFSGILPAVCAATESSFDSHFKFHGMTALQICLQQIKASITNNTTSAALEELTEAADRTQLKLASFVPFPAAMTSRVMQIIWNNWEDPLNQTVRQVQMVFDLLADLQSLRFVRGDGDGTKSFLHQIASDLLTVGGNRKGRYVPLATLALRIGARNLLEMSPELLFQTVSAFSDDGVCCAASSFLKIFLERLRDECWSSGGVSEGSREFRRLWLPPMLGGLVAGNPRLRINLHTYALPIGLEVDTESLIVMLGFVLDGSTKHEAPEWEELRGATGMPQSLTQNQRVAAFVSLVKVARALALMENEFTSEESGEMVILVKGVRISAPVSLLELALTHLEEGLRVDAAELICLNPKTAVLPSPLEIHLLRVAMPLNMRCSSTAFRMKWTSLTKKFFNRVRVSTDREMKLKLGSSRNGFSDALGRSVVTLSEMQEFMHWLTRLLVSSLYPSAPYERKYMAMEILNVLLDVWKPGEELGSKFSPFARELFSPEYSMVLLGAVVDSWDRLREDAFRILIRYPTPLPGLGSGVRVAEVLRWGKTLASSPRVRESDAGALVLRLVFRKYVAQLGWRVALHPEPEAVQESQAGDEVVRYIESLNDWLEDGVVEGERDLLKACKQSLVHGVLLTLRYTISDLDWISDSVRGNVVGIRRAFERLFKLLLRVTSLALWVVSADALNLQEDDEGDEMETTLEGDFDGDDEGRVLAPKEQMVMVGCWLSMKEVSLLLGTIARGAPLPGCSYNATRKKDGARAPEVVNGERFVVLEPGQLEEIGQHFLQVLLAMKHNGAIDKTRIGFVALCNRLLLSSDTRLSKMPEAWMQQLMEHTIAKDQSMDDLLRRSAGIPASFLALFLSEPDGAPKKLLPMGLGWLIESIRRLSEGDREEASPVVPVVHAFNTLRATFNDTYMATDTSGFCAEAMIVSIKAFASPFWQVRNSATLAFTALLHRTVGFLNVHKQAMARRMITGFEFFNRYPALHPFLLKELELATSELELGERSSLGVHPSLAPILVILSRLRPSILNTKVDDWLSPSAFMPSVMKCATLSNLKVRVLASRALAPLVTADKLREVLLELAGSLSTGSRSSNGCHGVLLQMSSLLRSNCVELPSREEQERILVEVFGSLRSWNERRGICPVVASATLRVLEDLMDLGFQCQRVVPELNACLLTRALEALSSQSSAHSWDSTRVDLRATAAKIYFTAVLRAWSSSNSGSSYTTIQQAGEAMLQPSTKKEFPEFIATLRECLADEMYEVRLATLKALKAFSRVSSESFVELDGRRLHGLLAERLHSEKHPRCIKRILQVLLSWELLKIDDDQQDPVELWRVLLRFQSESTVSKTREAALCCLGSCLRHLAQALRKKNVSGSSEALREVFETWERLIRRHSQCSEPVNLRRAVSSAIVASGCLEDARWLKREQEQEISWYSGVVLSVWSTSINLLEDEDVSLRQQLALAIQGIISGPGEASVPAQVERVLENALVFLREQFGSSKAYFSFLASRVLGEQLFLGPGAAQNSEFVRKLFDKEVDNHHEEQLLLVQLCCSSMMEYAQRPDSSQELVSEWRARLLRQAVACSRWCLELQRSTQWVGGITNHQDVFRCCYRTLLGLFVLPPGELSEEMKAGLLEITSLKELPLSPMIGNLILSLLVKYEKRLEVSLGADSFRAAIGESFCSEFQPFFLLKKLLEMDPSDAILLDLRSIGAATQDIGLQLVAALDAKHFGFLTWLATLAAIFLLIVDRTKWKTDLLTGILVPYIWLNLPPLLFGWFRGELGKWIAFIAVLVRLFLPRKFPEGAELPVAILLFIVTAPNFLAVNFRNSGVGMILSLVIGCFLLVQHINNAGGFRKAFGAQHGIPNTIGILLLFVSPLWEIIHHGL